MKSRLGKDHIFIINPFSGKLTPTPVIYNKFSGDRKNFRRAHPYSGEHILLPILLTTWVQNAQRYHMALPPLALVILVLCLLMIELGKAMNVQKFIDVPSPSVG